MIKTAVIPAFVSAPASVRLILLCVFWTAMVTASHWPGIPSPYILQFEDKVFHFAAYGLLAALLAWNFAPSDPTKWKIWRKRAFWGLAAHAMVDEVTQLLVNRSCDPLDWLADMVGVWCALTLTEKLYFRSDRRV